MPWGFDFDALEEAEQNHQSGSTSECAAVDSKEGCLVGHENDVFDQLTSQHVSPSVKTHWSVSECVAGDSKEDCLAGHENDAVDSHPEQRILCGGGGDYGPESQNSVKTHWSTSECVAVDSKEHCLAGHENDAATSHPEQRNGRCNSKPWLGKFPSFSPLVLWPLDHQKPRYESAYAQMDVCVFGAHHCCTNAMMSELPRFFNVKIKNKHYHQAPSLWKHSIYYKGDVKPQFTRSTFCVCLVKDPAFWIQSLARSPKEGTFYDIIPLSLQNVQGQSTWMPVQPHYSHQLFGPVLFNGRTYNDALHVWQDATLSYFDETLFPRERTAIVRCEDFQFSFEAVFRELAQRGLPLRANIPEAFAPLNHTAKDATHPDCTRRNRQDLLQHYCNVENRLKGLSFTQKDRISKIDRGIVEPLGYGPQDSLTWLPRSFHPCVD